jgi:aspartyl-tRNA(Asn)/glutamyl-tRNA(Gln) amidotransferase subunit A
VVDKLNEAGVVVLGKTNQDAWAHGASGENSDFGPTLNPVDESRVPGGSSSGSAAAVAAGMVPIATGTDTGGSIRQPANFCGVVGLKPSYGRVSRYGVVAMASSLDTMGVLAGDVESAGLVFAQMAGEDSRDATSKGSLPFDISSLEKDIKKGLRVGIPREYFDPIKDLSIKENFGMVVKKLESMGVEIRDLSLPRTEQAIATYYIIQPAEVASNLSRYDGVRYGNGQEKMGEEARRRIALGNYTLSAGYADAYYKKALKMRTLIIEDFKKAYEEVDLIMAPVSPTLPFKLGERVADPVEMYMADVLTVPANIAGLASLAMPTGKNDQGLPFGIQLMSPSMKEEEIFPLAINLEKHV